MEDRLFPMYLEELLFLAFGIRENCESLFELTNPRDAPYWLGPDPQLITRVTAILLGAANINKLVRNSGERKKGETQGAYRIRKRRTQALQDLLSGIELKEMFNTKVRNSLEHLDEHLDQAIAQLSSGNVPSPPAEMYHSAAYNISLSSRGAVVPTPYPVRMYVADERKFYNLRYVVDIGAIYEESLEILARLRAKRGGIDRGPAGMLIRLE